MSKDVLENYNLEFHNFKEHIAWWEKRRLWFNGLLFLSGFIPYLINGGLSLFFSWLLIPIVLYALVANLFYCLGWGFSILHMHYISKGNIMIQGRSFLFWTGLVVSILITLAFSISASSLSEAYILP